MSAIAPYASQLIGDTFEHTDDPNKAAQLLSHAVLGAVIAYMNGGDAVSGAASATASELASMALAKELYPEAFDENGNLVRSRLSEEQAQGIVAITNAIGALAGGITGGDSYDAGIGAFIGENAVVNNTILFWGKQASGGMGVSGAIADGEFVNITFRDWKLIEETGVYFNYEYGIGTLSIGAGGEVGIMFTGDVEQYFNGNYANMGVSLGSNPFTIGGDLTVTSVEENSQDTSAIGLTLNGSVGTGLPVEGHVRKGNTGAQIENTTELLDFSGLRDFLNTYVYDEDHPI